MAESDIARVVEVFEACHADWVLVGAHAIGLLAEPRATADFDFVVESCKLGGVVRALKTEFGELEENDIGAAIQLKAIDVDLIRSSNHVLFETAPESHAPSAGGRCRAPKCSWCSGSWPRLAHGGTGISACTMLRTSWSYTGLRPSSIVRG